MVKVPKKSDSSLRHYVNKSLNKFFLFKNCSCTRVWCNLTASFSDRPTQMDRNYNQAKNIRERLELILSSLSDFCPDETRKTS